MGDFQHATFDYLQVSRVCTSASSSWVPAGTFSCEPHGSFTQQTAKDELRLHVICYILWSKNMIGWYDWLIYIYIYPGRSPKRNAKHSLSNAKQHRVDQDFLDLVSRLSWASSTDWMMFCLSLDPQCFSITWQCVKTLYPWWTPK